MSIRKSGNRVNSTTTFELSVTVVMVVFVPDVVVTADVCVALLAVDSRGAVLKADKDGGATAGATDATDSDAPVVVK